MSATVAARPVAAIKETPLLGSMRHFQNDRLDLWRTIARQGSDATKIHFGPFPLFVFNSPELAQATLVDHANDFDKGVTLRRAFQPIAGNGLFTNEGDDWRHQRKLMAPALTARHIASYADTMASYAERAQDSWRDGQRIRIDKEMTALTMGIVGKALFDAEFFDEADELGAAVTVALQFLAYNISHLFPVPINWPTARSRRTRAAIATIDRRLLGMIGERRASGEDRGDLLSLLLAARDEDGVGMSDKQIRDEAITLFMAGHETTASTLAWAWYMLAQQPDCYARLQEEADRVLGDRALTLADLPNLPYAMQVFKETLRLYPPADSVTRTALHDVEVAGYSLKKNDIVIIPIYSMHRRPDFFPDPERFDPDRFTPENEKKLPRYAYMPFGAGPRVCIGNHFALMEGQIALATLARRVTFELLPDQNVEPESVFAIRMKNGCRMLVHRR